MSGVTIDMPNATALVQAAVQKWGPMPDDLADQVRTGIEAHDAVEVIKALATWQQRRTCDGLPP